MSGFVVLADGQVDQTPSGYWPQVTISNNDGINSTHNDSMKRLALPATTHASSTTTTPSAGHSLHRCIATVLHSKCLVAIGWVIRLIRTFGRSLSTNHNYAIQNIRLATNEFKSQLQPAVIRDLKPLLWMVLPPGSFKRLNNNNNNTANTRYLWNTAAIF